VINIKELFLGGIEKLREEHDQYEETKLGTLRAGNTGALLNNGEGPVIGTCQRPTYLRMKGIDSDQPTILRELMFFAGRLNEEMWIRNLSRTWEGTILQEQEIPTRWLTQNGTPVTGRPDLVLLNKEGVSTQALELKLASSVWTVRDIFKGMPKIKHTLQAAHYSMELGVPIQIWYTNWTDWHVPFPGPFPKYGEPYSEYCEFNYYKEGALNPRTRRPIKHKIEEAEFIERQAAGMQATSEAFRIGQFIEGFELEWSDSESLSYRKAGSDSPWIATNITKDSIRAYYELIANMDESQDFGPVAENRKVDGSLEGWKFPQYCSLPAELCCGSKENKDLTVAEWSAKVENHYSEEE
jgi:hypothetical protein